MFPYTYYKIKWLNYFYSAVRAHFDDRDDDMPLHQLCQLILAMLIICDCNVIYILMISRKAKLLITVLVFHFSQTENENARDKERQ